MSRRLSAIEPLESRIVPAAAIFELSSLDGSTGFMINGVAVYDQSGYSVSEAGDVNGDGFDDLVIGAFRAGPNDKYSSGSTYVVFGQDGGFSAVLDLSALDGSNGFRIDGVAEDDYSGRSVSAAGDVNGDNFDDLLIGADGADPHGESSGVSYVVFGKRTFSAALDLSTLNGVNGFRITGEAEYDYSGRAVSAAGDIDGDGFADLLIGAPDADAGGQNYSGASYVVFGKKSGFTASLSLSALDGADGFKIVGESADNASGASVSAAGDINSDGFDDFLIGTDGTGPEGQIGSGASYVVFGKKRGFGRVLDLSKLNGDNGFKIAGELANDSSRSSVGAAGDVNGDGFDDVVIGTYGADAYGESSGAGYVVFGKAGGFDTALNLSALDGTNGFKINGAAASDAFGVPVSGAGDFNGDGFDDVLIGAPGANPQGDSSGASYVVFGKAQGFAAMFDVSTLDGANGFKINGQAAGENSGASVSAAGDVNGDSFDDLLIGAPGASPNDVASGAAYVVFGRGPDPLVSISDAATLEGDSGTASLTFTVSLSVRSSQTVTVQYSTVDGTARAPEDYSARAPRTLTFRPGELSKTIVIPVTGDELVEANETFFVNLSDATDADLGDAQGLGTILNDDRVITLGDLDGTDGFQVSGAAIGDRSGYSVSAGDVNGDGFDDVIIGAPRADSNGTDSGASYVAFGKASGFAANLDLSSLDGSNGFQLSGVAAGDDAGRAVSAAGDVNGDGFDDLIIGAAKADANGPDSGAGYVVFGKASGFAASLHLSTLDGSNGFRLSGVAPGDYAGFSVSAAGDVNGDGLADVIIGARDADPNGIDSGASYVVFGRVRGFAANLELSTLDGTNGFKLSGVAAGDNSGSVSAAGDVNADGVDDLIIGAPKADPHGTDSGASYVVFGRVNGFAASLELSALDGTNGFKLSGVVAGGLSGFSVSAAHDVNDDGFSDLIVGAHGAGSNGSGASYVVFGKADGFEANLDLSSLDGTNGFSLSGVAAGDSSGFSVSGAGDFNDDGFDDILVGAPFADPAGDNAGASYLVFGKASGFGANVELSALNGTNGLKFNSIQLAGNSGRSVSAAGDVNGDGFDDVIIGAFDADAKGTDSGASYVIFGRASSAPPALSISDTSVTETANGTVIASFTVSLSAPASQAVTVQYGTGDSTARAPNDFTALALTTLTFSPGETSKTVSVAVTGDAVSEPDESFFVNLSNPTNATIADGQGKGMIFDNGGPGVVISSTGKTATFTDVDGDKVTIKMKKGLLSAANLVFGADGTLMLIDLHKGTGDFNGASITIDAERAGGGDGLVNVGAIDGAGFNLGKVTIEGDLGQIDVGNGAGKALKSLAVGSLGTNGATTQLAGTEHPLLSEVAGALSKLAVERDVMNAIVEVSDKLGKVLIGGSLIDNAPSPAASASIGVFNNGGIPPVGASRAGTIFAPNIGPVTVDGDINGGEITADEEIKSVRIVGRLMSDNPLDPAILRAGAGIDRIVINDDVQNALILAGYNRKFEPRNPDANIGKVVVNGDWTASSVVAGVADPLDDGFGRTDTLIEGDETPDLVSRIASVVIKGTVSGSSISTDHSAITAQKIGALRISGEVVPLTSGPDNLLLDALNRNFRAVELPLEEQAASV